MVELVPAVDGFWCAIEVSNITVGEVVATIEEGLIKSGLMTKEAGSPDPWIAFDCLMWGYDDAVRIVGSGELKVVAFVAIEVA